MSRLIKELRRRNVFRVGIAYLVLAWVLLQIGDVVFEALNLDNTANTLLLAILAIGFIPAVIFAWVFELTPDGLKKDTGEDLAPSSRRGIEKKLNIAVIVLLLVGIALLAADRLIPKPAAVSVVNETEVSQPSPEDVTANATPNAEPAAPENSIAVLPFVNMSADPEQEYFSDGISEEILNVLARVPELQVAARTSSFSFKGGKLEVPEIAETLNVRMVLEGSVRKQGDQVRITAQLIDAQSGFHLWSETFDRELKDIFAIQDEIALAIGEALKLKLDVAAMTKDAEPTDLQAHNLYLRALALWHLREEKALWQAVDLLEQAIAIDPNYAEAHAGLALVYAVVSGYSAQITNSQATVLASRHAQQALALDINLPEPYAVLGSIATAYPWRDTASALFQRAIGISPSFATAHQWQSTALLNAGRLDEALLSIRRAVELDPRSRVIGGNHATVLMSLGRWDEGIAACERVYTFVPGYSYCIGSVAFAVLQAGELDKAKLAYDALVTAASKPTAQPLVDELFEVLRGRGNRRDVAERLAAFPSQSAYDPNSPNLFDDIDTPQLLVLLGENGLALDYLEAWSNRPPSTNIEWPMMSPALDPVRCEPRFIALVAKRETHDPHFERVCGA